MLLFYGQILNGVGDLRRYLPFAELQDNCGILQPFQSE